MTIEEVMSDVSRDELELWSGAHRREGRPSAASKAVYARRDELVVAIAAACTEVYPQTIRHIYYLCSGLGLVGKDHGKEAYWYSIVGDAIGKARWNNDLDWNRIVDDSRPFETPAFWENDAAFLRSVIPQFALDKWKGQNQRVIVCTEKNAIMGMLSAYCREWHIPLMSFHGQASDGGGVQELAKYIVGLPKPVTDEHLDVHCFYFGDFDPAGASIDRSVFGDEQAEGDSNQEREERVGRLNRLVWKLTNYADGVPLIRYERIGVTIEDVCNQEYAPYLLEVNPKDMNFDRYKEDTSEIEDFPTLGIHPRTGKPLPATLGIDALSAEELIGRVERNLEAILDVDDNAEWQKQKEALQTQQSKLVELIPE